MSLVQDKIKLRRGQRTRAEAKLNYFMPSILRCDLRPVVTLLSQLSKIVPMGLPCLPTFYFKESTVNTFNRGLSFLCLLVIRALPLPSPHAIWSPAVQRTLGGSSDQSPCNTEPLITPIYWASALGDVMGTGCRHLASAPPSHSRQSPGAVGSNTGQTPGIGNRLQSLAAPCETHV